MPYRAHPSPPRVKRRGLQECFACHASVLPNDRRECPSCGQSVDEARDDGRRSLTIPNDADLPGYCARCGEETARHVELRLSRVDQSAGGHSTAFRIALAVIWPLAALFVRSRRHETMTLKLPVCENCGQLEPEHVDFERRELTLIVHRRLRDALLIIE